MADSSDNYDRRHSYIWADSPSPQPDEDECEDDDSRDVHGGQEGSAGYRYEFHSTTNGEGEEVGDTSDRGAPVHDQHDEGWVTLGRASDWDVESGDHSADGVPVHDIAVPDETKANDSDTMTEPITTTASGSDPYSNATDHGSGTIRGPGFGNEKAADTDIDTSDTRLGTAHLTSSYSGGTEHGSGTTAGPGWVVPRFVAPMDLLMRTRGRAGNKMPPSAGKDSMVGKVMEKVGGVLKKEELVEKGRERREERGAFDEE